MTIKAAMNTFERFSGRMGAIPQSVPAGLPVARIHLDDLRRNWLTLAALAKSSPPMAVVKADAYGHGLGPVAKTVLEAGCRTLAAGSVDEGVLLRRILANSGCDDVRIIPLLGILSEQDAASAVAHGLLPVVGNAEQAAFVSAAWTHPSPLPIAVKVETGMSRLGFREHETAHVVAALRTFDNLCPCLLLSHLAASDEPSQDDAVALQVERFLAAYAALRDYWPSIALSLANSAAYLAQDTLLAALPSHIARPGYALYGGNPFAGTRREHLGTGFAPVMEVAAPVMGVHDLAPGRTVSYGGTFTAERHMRIAIVGAGYADGFSRSLSGKGQLCIRGRRCSVLGRVCMQMLVVDVSHVPDVSVGDTAYILGGEGPGAISPDALARDWGTIPYEIFCLLGKNPRVY